MRISFLSGTRADYSKIKPYIEYLKTKKNAEIYLFVTAMHVLPKYGNTYQEIQKDFGKKCHVILDKTFSESNTSQEFAHIISAYDKHLRNHKIDFVFVHGDRPEALAGAITCRLNNIPLCQIEAGDQSGSIDDSIRHAITKLAHRFLVSDKMAENILLKLSEDKKNIFVTGNSSLANKFKIDHFKPSDYNIPFTEYAILIYHPVTTVQARFIQKEIRTLMKCLIQSGLNYVVIMPNNDLHNQIILKEYDKNKRNEHFCFFKSLPTDIFTNLLINAQFLIGNSSCGIKEAPYYHIPVIDIGTRQQNRYQHLDSKYFHHVNSVSKIPNLIREICRQKSKGKTNHFRQSFFKKLGHVFKPSFWNPNIQKTPIPAQKKKI